jgi:hypothetical protein
LDNKTKKIEINLNQNPKYNIYFEKDDDNDWIENNIDNCKSRYNPNQIDSNGDGI